MIMDQTVVKATEGRTLGSRPSRRLRAEGRLPGVVYGLGKDPQSVSVSYADLRAALSGEAGMNTVLALDIDGTQQMVLVKDVQRDPIKRMVTHADFVRVDSTKKVRVKVPIKLVGDASKVTSIGAMVEQKRFELELLVSPESIPLSIEADLSALTLDDRISVGDLNLPEGSTTVIPDNISVAAAVISRAAKVAADEEEELEGEEGEEAEGEASEDGDGGEGADDAGGGE
jgi:large subunit ribosomal protein L25